MKILVTGGSGMVGKSLVPELNKDSSNTVYAPSHAELNLLNQQQVASYINQYQPDLIIHLAAKVGGIQANINEAVDFLVQNLLMGTHIIQQAAIAGVPRLINMGSSCMYPKDRALLTEDDLLDGKLEPTNEGYALAKNSSAVLCDAINKQYGYHYKTLIPCNLYGPNDNFDPITSHLAPAVIRKLHQAKQDQQDTVCIWGDGNSRREFLFVDDLVNFILLAKDKIKQLPQNINVGFGQDYTINEYYQIAAEVIGYNGDFIHDLDKPTGMKCKLLDVTKASSLGWQAKTSLQEGIAQTYEHFKKTHA